MKNLSKITSIVITLLMALPSFTGLTITASAAPPVSNGANKPNLSRITSQHTDHADTTLNSDEQSSEPTEPIEESSEFNNADVSFEETIESEVSEESEYEEEEETEKDENEEETEKFGPSDDTNIKPDAPDYPKIPENYKNYNQPPYGNTPLGLTPSTSPSLTPSLSPGSTPISIGPLICDTQNEFYNNNNPQSSIKPISPPQAPPFNFTTNQFPQSNLLLPPNYHPINNTSGTASNNVSSTHTSPSNTIPASPSQASSFNPPLQPAQPTLLFPPTYSSSSNVFSRPMPTSMFPSPLSSSSLSSSSLSSFSTTSSLTTPDYDQEENNLCFSTLSTQHQSTSVVSNFEHPQARNNPLLINHRNNINNQNTIQHNNHSLINHRSINNQNTIQHSNPFLINYRNNINNQNTITTDNMVGSDDDDDDEQEETMSVLSTYSNSPQASPAVHGLNNPHSEDNSFSTDNININNQNNATNCYENHLHLPTPPTVLNNEQVGNNPGVLTPHQNAPSSSSLSSPPSMVPISRASFSTTSTSPLTTIGNNNQEDAHHSPAHSNSNQNTRTSDNDTNSENHSPTQNKI